MRNLAFTLALLSSSTCLWAGGGGGEDDQDGDIPLTPIAVPKKSSEELIISFQKQLREHIKNTSVHDAYLAYLNDRTRSTSPGDKEALWVFLLKVLPLMPVEHRDFATLTRICTLHQHLGADWCNVLYRALHKTEHKADIKEKLLDLLVGLGGVTNDKIQRYLKIFQSMNRKECTVETLIDLTKRLNKLSEENFNILETYKARLNQDEHGRFYPQSLIDMMTTLEVLSDKDLLLDPVIKAINLHYDGFAVEDVEAIREHAKISDMPPYRHRFMLKIKDCDDDMFDSIMASYIPCLRVLCLTRARDFAKERLRFESQKMTDLIRLEYKTIEAHGDSLTIKRLAFAPVTAPQQQRR